MKREGKHLIDQRGTKYATVPWYLVEKYHFSSESKVAYDDTDSDVLLVKISNRGADE